ncbi:DUF2268 domain-containing putative Zn-dependent protease [Lewinella sp. IMCC34191]|uniref:DUF2268 domain-containing putative Zn-dependent protease n=1 Tax=Lewinella sp. IMCC34191 TaxID=2259172 RepID=UPI000E24694F|nr:DUF2268 domain-containing putative Zn-dependent protease [Lewinella sp. IMCC34191]
MDRYPHIRAVLILLGCLVGACSPNPESAAPEADTASPSLETFPDSFQLGEIVLYNAFKHQIGANQSNPIDSQRIVDRVYHRHQSLWTDCYGMIFGEENAPLFQTDSGMVAWNTRLYREHRMEMDSIAELFVSQRIDTLFAWHMARFTELDYAMPRARISIAFTPLTGIGFGGCANDQFVLELNNPDYELIYTLEKGIPHELYHLINEDASTQRETFQAIDLVINEGLACYFVYDYFGGKVPKHEAVENMSAADWDYYLAHETEILEQTRPYFTDTSGDNPLLRNDRYGLFPDAPRSLSYWLGFRIVERYLAEHPKATIRDLVALPYQEIYAGSGYGS